MTVTGGVRARLIGDSLFYTVRDSLDSLGWFDTGRAHEPVHMREEPVEMNEPVPLNTIAFEPGISRGTHREVGSEATEDTIPFFIDVYAESRSLGIHLANDIKDILRGQMPDIGRNASVVQVYDWRQATPPLLFGVEVEDVRVDVAHNWSEPFRRHWFSLTVTLIDETDPR